MKKMWRNGNPNEKNVAERESYKEADLLSTGQLFQFFQDGFEYTSTSGLRFSTVSGSLRLQFRLLASGPRFEKISALRAASSLKKKAL